MSFSRLKFWALSFQPCWFWTNFFISGFVFFKDLFFKWHCFCFCHSCPPCHGQNILGELFLMLQNPPRSTNNLSTSESKPWIPFLGLMGQGTKLDSWKQQKREKILFSYSSEGPKTQNQVVGQDRFLPGPSKGEDIPRLSPILSVSWLMMHHSSLCLRLHMLALCVSLCLKSPSFDKNPRTWRRK